MQRDRKAAVIVGREAAESSELLSIRIKGLGTPCWIFYDAVKWFYSQAYNLRTAAWALDNEKTCNNVSKFVQLLLFTYWSSAESTNMRISGDIRTHRGLWMYFLQVFSSVIINSVL